jgi:hypothetical protein
MGVSAQRSDHVDTCGVDLLAPTRDANDFDIPVAAMIAAILTLVSPGRTSR